MPRRVLQPVRPAGGVSAPSSRRPVEHSERSQPRRRALLRREVPPRHPRRLRPLVCGPSRPASGSDSAACRGARRALCFAPATQSQSPGRRARGRARSSRRTCPQCPGQPDDPVRLPPMPAHRSASHRGDDPGYVECRPEQSSNRRCRRCARPAAAHPRTRHTPRIPPRGRRLPNTRGPTLPPRRRG